MDKRKMRIIFLTGVIACFSFLVSVAQPVIKTSVDKNEILIGDQFHLKMEAAFLPEEYKINWPVIADSLPHFEVVSRSKIDSLYNNNRLTGLVQTFTITSFDSGKWVLPSFLVSMVPAKDDTTYNFFTDSIPVIVSFSASDTTNVLKDIKPIREAEPANRLWYWIAAVVLLTALVVFLIWFFRFYKKNKTSATPFKSKTSPYEEALKELQNLKAYDFSAPADIKIVHSKLGEIFKRYLSHTQKVSYSNKTTGDVLILLRDHFLDIDMPVKAAACLRCGDAVKFAKYLPPASESEQCVQSVKDIISDLHQKAQNPATQAVKTKP